MVDRASEWSGRSISRYVVFIAFTRIELEDVDKIQATIYGCYDFDTTIRHGILIR